RYRCCLALRKFPPILLHNFSAIVGDGHCLQTLERMCPGKWPSKCPWPLYLVILKFLSGLGNYPHGLRREDRSLSIANTKRLLGLDRPGFWIVGLMRTHRTLNGKGLTDKRLTFCS